MRYFIYILVLLASCGGPARKGPAVRAVPLVIEKADPVHFRVVVFVTDSEDKAQLKKRELEVLQPNPVLFEVNGRQISLHVGRFRNRQTALKLKNDLIDLGYAGAAVVTMPGRYNE